MMLIIKKIPPPFEDACLEKYRYLMMPLVIWIYEALQAIILKSYQALCMADTVSGLISSGGYCFSGIAPGARPTKFIWITMIIDDEVRK